MGIYSESLAEKIKRKIEGQIEEQKAQFKLALKRKKREEEELEKIQYEAYLKEKKRQEALKAIKKAKAEYQRKPFFGIGSAIDSHWKKGRTEYKAKYRKKKGKKGRARHIREPKKKKKPPMSFTLGGSITGESIDVFG